MLPGIVLYIFHAIKSSKHLLRDYYYPLYSTSEEMEAWRGSPMILYVGRNRDCFEPTLDSKFMLLFILPVLTKLFTKLFILIVAVGF